MEHPDPEFVVHCSGGIGRSGTFLTAYGAYCHFLQNNSNLSEENTTPFSLFETVKALRLQRHPWMVEGIQQYQMAYAISDYLNRLPNQSVNKSSDDDDDDSEDPDIIEVPQKFAKYSQDTI